MGRTSRSKPRAFFLSSVSRVLDVTRVSDIHMSRQRVQRTSQGDVLSTSLRASDGGVRSTGFVRAVSSRGVGVVTGGVVAVGSTVVV